MQRRPHSLARRALGGTEADALLTLHDYSAGHHKNRLEFVKIKKIRTIKVCIVQRLQQPITARVRNKILNGPIMLEKRE